jgi:hypothetical protein
MNKYRIDVQDLANFIFVENKNNLNVIIEISSIKSNQELFFFLFDLLCKGLVLVYGENDSNQVCLNHLTIEQFEFMKTKFKNAHIKLNIVIYDHATAILLDLLDENYKKRNLIKESISKLESMETNEPLKDYIFNILIEDNLFCINFEVITA